ncbi:hypothetical protein CB0940_09501 [Cercospora beticola]|uniref:Uncharacterized protein n=1 Tax=Cercospora beticola TaxID=122368 RepID=A0A2G5HG15_CERBT|nr:hypothetical protein CB0940_09501 [Cercospora beticola]PIA91480.1 hypothetical protein CB0940_09501 [Cercospora beticola]
MMMRRMELDDVDAQSRSPLSLSLPLALASSPTPAKAKELRNTRELPASIALFSLHRRQPASRIWESTACRRIGSLGTAPTELIRVAGLTSQELASQSYVILATSASCPPGQTTTTEHQPLLLTRHLLRLHFFIFCHSPRNSDITTAKDPRSSRTRSHVVQRTQAEAAQDGHCRQQIGRQILPHSPIRRRPLRRFLLPHHRKHIQQSHQIPESGLWRGNH